MRKNVYGRQLSRTKNQRQALFKGLMIALTERGEIVTTLAKAKAIRPQMEKLVTKAKRADISDRRQILKVLGKTNLVNRLCDVIAPVFKEKQGGYLRIIRVGTRTGDRAEMVKVMFTEKIPVEVPKEKITKEEKVSPSSAPPELRKGKKVSPTSAKATAGKKENK
jgi:large subunit ribosomal protein L17